MKSQCHGAYYIQKIPKVDARMVRMWMTFDLKYEDESQ